MLTIWRCVSPSRPDHIYRYGLVWTATKPQYKTFEYNSVEILMMEVLRFQQIKSAQQHDECTLLYIEHLTSTVRVYCMNAKPPRVEA